MDLDTTASAENPQPPVGGGGRRFTSKQMGDACEMLVAAELTLAGIPALKVPDNWPHYDVIAQPVGAAAQRISVKSRTFKRGAAFVDYKAEDLFDWLAIVILSGDAAAEREVYMVPKAVADHHARRDKPTSKTASQRYYRIDEVERLFGAFRGNFALDAEPAAQTTGQALERER
ncbi:hypothetical protein [Brevundimonas bullata]|uniref:hypothetical protein n=1 Tax=Brevundimonas bullata TaxID=13160 RepID=UPI002FD97278